MGLFPPHTVRMQNIKRGTSTLQTAVLFDMWVFMSGNDVRLES
jgi:hypothetical protein